MSRVVWDDTGNKKYELGTDRGVLYPVDDQGNYSNGVPWDGLRSINEAPSGAEETALYANNGKYGGLYSAEEFSFTIGAYTSPKEFDVCDGTVALAPGFYATQQDRRRFGMTYRTLIGNDTENMNHGYKVHIVYGATPSPTERDHSTVNESPEAEELNWECKTIPVPIPGGKPSAHFILDSTIVPPEVLAAIEDILYGTDADGNEEGTPPTILLPARILELYNELTSTTGGSENTNG